jgi:hypothetical protein
MQGCVSFAAGLRISTLLTFFLATSLTGIQAWGQNTFAMHSHGSTGAASACNKGRWDGPIDLAPETMRGKLTHPVSTTSKEVQGYFDQGLVFLYGFDNESAMRSFHKAALLDPKLAMAHWGVALAAGGDLNIAIDDPCMARAADEIAQAKKLGSASLPEQRYIKALSCRYAVVPSCDDAHPVADPEDLSLAYADQMRLLYQMDNGTDPDAAGLFAYALMDLHPWQWWRHDGTPTPEIVETVKVIQTGLPNFPNHIGLNHIYIHAMEEAPIPKAVAAAKSAEFLRRNAPAITPHLAHMPAHTFLLQGRWNDVVAANTAAVAADEPWAKACLPDSASDRCNQLLVGHYYSHDMLFLAVGYDNQGRWDEVAPLADRLEANAATFLPTQHGLEHYLTTRVMMMVHFGKWTELAAMAKPAGVPDPSLPTDQFCEIPHTKLAGAIWYFGQAMAHASLKQPTDADVRGFQKERQCVAEASLGWGNNQAASILEVVHARMLERIHRAKGELVLANRLAEEAVTDEDALAYDEPPGWYLSSRETCGAGLYLMGSYAEAKAVFLEDQRRRPNNSRSLFGLWMVDREIDKAHAAAAEEAFRAQWKGSVDPKMSDL